MAGAAGGFVTRAFDAMLKECSGKKYTSLQSAIQSYLDGVKEGNQQAEVSEAAQKSEHTYDESHGESSVGDEQVVKPARTSVSIAIILSNVGHKLEGAQAELVLNPLRLAFETKNIKVVEPALDCLHKLIAYDHLEGDPGLDDGENAALFGDILSIVCSCVDNSSDSTILQVLKVLLTAVASTKFRVHGEPLLGVIRACYNIYLNSKSAMNQVTSKAMLTQMISIIFRKMESDPTFSNVLEELHDQSPSESISHTEDTSISGSKTGVEGGLVDDQNERGITEADTVSQKSVKDASIASIEELLNLASGADMQGLEAIMDKAVNFEDVNKIKNDIDLENMSIGHRDALLVFHTLCKMGMKEGSDDIATKTRILSFEILQALLEGVSDALTKNFHLISSVKACLSYALLRASVSSSPVIFQHTAGIFAVLLLRFRKNLKGEIGILFSFLAPHKWRKVAYGGMQPGFDDNHTDESFLEDMVTNANVVKRDLFKVMLDSVSISQYLCIVSLVVVVWSNTLSSTISYKSLLLLDVILLVSGFLVLLLTTKMISFKLLFQYILNISYFIIGLYALSPIYHTLTRSISSDSIWALTTLLIVLHLFLHDYTGCTMKAPGSPNNPTLSSNISLNLSIIASVLIASRLPSRPYVFATMLFSLQVFLFAPFVLYCIKRYSFRLHLCCSLGLVCLTLTLVYKLQGFLFGVLLGLLVFIIFICPYWLIRIQKYKFEINGPWDEAKLCFNITE